MTSATDFRRLPVDLYSEDYLPPSSLLPLNPSSPSTLLALSSTKLSQVKQLLQKGHVETALRTALRDPAYGEDDAGEVESAKGRSREAVAAVVGGVRGTEVEGVIKGLSGEEQLVLMKYLYKAMETITENQNGNVILSWHEKLVELAGTGVIVRVMTDRRLI